MIIGIVIGLFIGFIFGFFMHGLLVHADDREDNTKDSLQYK